ncbi:hypothetical protein KQI86_15895 [Clostridium sp. MSJ-11]|uniref:DUF4013 domain-containing protein n=1 Tax=Clostridium mobile TaxID=2841512 RepID=A0ABS6EL74_9CLOT|nr:hypothetical protein [Clostridium mobile]MBU5485803.1 hypothetical protein [Clostridium mobile]
MFNSALKKFKDNYLLMLPFILVNYVMVGAVDIIGEGNAQITDKYDVLLNGGFSGGIGTALLILIIVSIVLGPLIYCSMGIVCKRAFKEEERISFIEAMKEASHYYFRYLGLNILIFAIAIGLALGIMLIGSMGPLIMITPLLLIALAAFMVTYEPCREYLVYYDVPAEEALSKGRKIGKKYYLEIILILIVSGVIGFIVGKLLQNNLTANLIVSFISINIQAFLVMFKMNLCHMESLEVGEIY